MKKNSRYILATLVILFLLAVVFVSVNAYGTRYRYTMQKEDADYTELPELCKDGDWDTYQEYAYGYYDIEYNKPYGAVGATWIVKDGALFSMPIPWKCWNYDSEKLYFKIKSGEGLGGFNYLCRYGDDNWYVLAQHDCGGYDFYEDAIRWNIKTILN